MSHQHTKLSFRLAPAALCRKQDEVPIANIAFVPGTLILNCMLHNNVANAVTAVNPSDLLHAEVEAQRLHDWTIGWHEEETGITEGDAVQQLHRANFDLWHLEDQARDPDATDSTIAQVKRAIDRTNQQRNDTVERIDSDLLATLADAGLPNEAAPLHSETPGMMLDRLSILALKIFHTAEQTGRTDVDAAHIRSSRERLSILQQQSSDLTACLAILWADICRGERRFRQYRQMKMYNDPDLNPVLYTAAKRSSVHPS
jgi:hypothetical protein